MSWFRKRAPKMVAIPEPTLTEEEQKECDQFIRLITGGEDHYAAPNVAERIQRALISMALISRAKRLCLRSRDAPALWDQGLSSAAKACAIYPIFIVFHDFGCLLETAGKKNEAQAVFAECIRSYESQKLGPADEAFVKQRNVQEILAYARSRI